MQIIRLWFLCLVALPVLAACQPGENEVQITTAAFTVENAALDLSGPQPVVIIQGQIPDTCTAVQPPTETLTGETLVLAVQMQRIVRPDAQCVGQPRPYDEAHLIQTQLPPGEYTLDINGFTLPFSWAFSETEIEPTTAPPVTCTGTFDAAFVDDVTIPDGQEIGVGSQFTKTWRVRNTGTCEWGSNLVLALRDSEQMSVDPITSPLPTVAPGAEVNLSKLITLSPDAPLGFATAARFELRDPDGQPFGTQLFVLVTPVGADSAPPIAESPPESTTGSQPSPPTVGAGISGVVWEDFCLVNAAGEPSASCVSDGEGGYHADGERAANEPGIAGVIVDLQPGTCANPQGDPRQALTGEDGRFAFQGLPAGEYCFSINIRLNAGRLVPGRFTAPSLDTNQIDLQLAENEQLADLDFGWDFMLR